MGTPKATSKAKKSSKLDSLKDFLFGHAAEKSPEKTHNKAVSEKQTKKKASPAAKKASTPPSKTPVKPPPFTKGAHKEHKGHHKEAHKNVHVKSTGKTPDKSSRSEMGLSLHKKSGTSTSSKGHHPEVVGDAVCREVACEGLATTVGYCRLHYIKNWKKIKRKEVILREKKLNQYIEELIAKYPEKYIEAIRQDLASDKDFAKVIYDLDLDETLDEFDIEGGESVDSLIDTIKRDFDDETETF